MKVVTRTGYGAFVQVDGLTGIPFELVASTTLNERWGVQSGVAPTPGTLPTMRYFVIGNGGHKLTVGANNIAKPEPVQHEATDAGLYNQIPFVLRELASDLTAQQMAGYRLRVPAVFNGVNYIAYYGKVLDYTGVETQMQLVTINSDGTQTVVPFVPDSSNLNPTPPALSSTGVNVVTGQYLTVSAKVPLNLTTDDATELENVANIIYGDPELAIISEIGLVTGVDKAVTGGGSGQPTIQYTEVIAAQIATIFNSFYAMEYANDGIQVLLDVGSTEPLLRLAAAPTTP